MVEARRRANRRQLTRRVLWFVCASDIEIRRLMEDSRLRAEHLQQVTTSTLPQPQPHHRLLYRGSLSLPDSHLLLDGLTFTGQAGKSTSLLENPLALALESMRGRPTLRFLGTMNLSEGWVDYSGGVCL